MVHRELGHQPFDTIFGKDADVLLVYRMIIELMKRLPNVSLLREITQRGSQVGKEKKPDIPRSD